MASNHVGGLSGAFIPVSEDDGMINAANCGSLTLEKLEAMTAVCSVGIDMVVIPGDTTAEVISGLIADGSRHRYGEQARPPLCASSRPSATRRATCWISAACWATPPSCPSASSAPAAVMIHRGGRIPRPMQALKN